MLLLVSYWLRSSSPNPPKLIRDDFNGGQLADSNILSPDRTVPFGLRFRMRNCWTHLYLCVVGLKVMTIPIKTASQMKAVWQYRVLGGAPRGKMRVDFPKVLCSMKMIAFHAISSGGAPVIHMLGVAVQDSKRSLRQCMFKHNSNSIIATFNFPQSPRRYVSINGNRAHFSFTLQDANGLESIDLIQLDVAETARYH